MPNRFDHCTFLVTGASSGIGRSTAIRLASEGATLVLVARNSERLEETRSQLSGVGHVVHTCDTADEGAVIQLMAAVRGEIGSLNGLVHCAGIHWLRPLQMTDHAALLQMFASHVFSSISLTRGLLTQRLISREGCSVVWMGSAASLQGGSGTVAYAAAKGALTSAARTLAVELARRRVRVNVIAPGVVRTQQSEALFSNMSPEQIDAVTNDHLLGLGQPEDIAGVVAFLLSDDAKWITGSTLVVDGGLTAH